MFLELWKALLSIYIFKFESIKKMHNSQIYHQLLTLYPFKSSILFISIMRSIFLLFFKLYQINEYKSEYGYLVQGIDIIPLCDEYLKLHNFHP